LDTATSAVAGVFMLLQPTSSAKAAAPMAKGQVIFVIDISGGKRGIQKACAWLSLDRPIDNGSYPEKHGERNWGFVMVMRWCRASLGRSPRAQKRTPTRPTVGQAQHWTRAKRLQDKVLTLYFL
jgi:hypothetical protein